VIRFLNDPPDQNPEMTLERTRFIEHKGERILLLDYSKLTKSEEILREIELTRAFIARLPKERTLRAVTDGTGGMYNKQVLQALKEMAAHNTPYILAGAVVSTSGLHRIALMTISTLIGRPIHIFATREEALDWLVEQKAPVG
jgi:hypothetical protein